MWDIKRHTIDQTSAVRATVRSRLTWFDLVAFALVGGMLAFVAWGMREFSAPISELKFHTITLDFANLPEYAMRTTLRMLVAVAISFLFTLCYATLAAKSRKAGQVMVPMLDIMQSIPVLGYISFTVTAFVGLFPHSMMGVELAAIFAIFTSQVWGMTFSLYQSLRTVPSEMEDAARVFGLSGWQKFWRMELPFAMPGLVWNMMVAMSGGWFFIVASEAITVGNQHITLPGIGSYIGLAIAERNIPAISAAIGAMLVVIILYDQFLFRPLVAWTNKFRPETLDNEHEPRSWLLSLFQRSRHAQRWLKPIGWFFHRVACLRVLKFNNPSLQLPQRGERLIDYIWYVLLTTVVLLAVKHIVMFLSTSIETRDIIEVAGLGMLTLLRVVVLIAVASLIWVPLGVYIGLRPRLAGWVQPVAQFLAAFPANLLFPIAVLLISHYKLSPDIWLSPLMILGTQWYILFNVIAGTTMFPGELLEVGKSFQIKRWLWWRKVALPGIFPYYITGAITASGGAWNASIVAELVTWGDERFVARGLGSYIAQMTQSGDFVRITLGVVMMALIVVLFNRFFWQPLYDMAARKLRFE
ncbi:MAG: ABC transporter permease subunit [Alphaproteobacteria bacterium]|nr:ABC transporter permease subunit [Alphaproteobacteria bacterium]